MSLCRVLSTSTPARFLLFVVLVCLRLVAAGQEVRYPVFSTVDSAEVWFDQIVNSVNAAIANGAEYRVTFQGLKSHPFFVSAESDRAEVRYDNDLYRNIDLLYDTYGDILVYKFITANNVLFIKLDNNMVESFNLHQHHFKKYKEGISAKIGAYFDVLFEENEFAVVVKRRKVERLEGNRSDYIEDDVHYILNNGKWIRITGSKSFSNTLPKDERKVFASFIKSNQINVRKRKDEDLKKVGAYCYSLKEKK